MTPFKREDLPWLIGASVLILLVVILVGQLTL